MMMMMLLQQWLWLWFIMLCKSSEEVCDLLRFLFWEEPMSSSTQFVDFLPKQRAVINVRDGTCFASNDIKNFKKMVVSSCNNKFLLIILYHDYENPNG